jgi:penicillin-binding protein 1A
MLLWLAVLSPLIGILVLLSAAALSDLPDFNSLENPKSDLATQIMTTDGKVLGKYYKQNRTNVSYEEISPFVYSALVSTEDERYYEHSGIDIEAVTRALAYMGKKGGGSTITQQLAKLLFTERRSDNKLEAVFQKAKEWIIAMRLEKSYTKQEILAMYLNQYDFLNQAVGIRSAANIYFDKEPINLTLAESAMLVGMLKNSALFNPLKRPELVLKRREVVLAQMKRNERLDQETYDSLRVMPLGLEYTRQSHDEGLAPYFREILRSELKTLLTSEDASGNLKYANPETGKAYDLYSDGLKVYTTIDSRLQEYAEFGVRAHMKNQLQGQFHKYLKTLRNPPFSDDLNKAEVNKILASAVKRSFRYRSLTGKLCANCERVGVEEQTIDGKQMYVCTTETCGHTSLVRSEKEIDEIFNTPTHMSVFTYAGNVDTLLSPMDSIRYYKSFLQAGLMSMDPRTGFVKAWVGGIDYKEFKYDHVKQGKRQVGSTFKPIIYATAIREGMSPCLEIPKVPTTFEKGTFNLDKDWTPQDSDHDYGYMATIKWGLANSINTMTAYVMKQFGPDPVVKLARDMGITSDLIAVPSLCLGVADLSVYEITAANSVFANQGVYVEPVIITRIEDKSGNSIYDVVPNTREAMDPRTAAIMIEMMKGTIDGVYNKHKDSSTGTAMRLRMSLDNRPYDGFSRDIKIACKTGTTQNQSDGWFIGMVPELATGIWVGAEDRSVRFGSLQLGMGTNMALPIWGYYMKKAYADASLGLEMKDFEKPEGLRIDDILDCESIHDANPFSIDSDGESIFD